LSTSAKTVGLMKSRHQGGHADRLPHRVVEHSRVVERDGAPVELVGVPGEEAVDLRRETGLRRGLPEKLAVIERPARKAACCMTDDSPPAKPSAAATSYRL
jgi:hypothetical protein